MGNIFHKKGIGRARDFVYYWRRIKKLKRRKVSLDKGPFFFFFFDENGGLIY